MRALILMVLVVGVAHGVAHAEPTRRELDRVLGGFEQVVNSDAVRSLGAGTDVALISYIEDRKLSSLRRQRALSALAQVPSATVRDYLVGRVRAQKSAERGAEVLELAAAIGALAPYGAQVLSTVTPLIGHPAPDVRQAAAVTLGTMRLPSTSTALAARLTIEPDPGVKAALRRALESTRR